MITQLTIENFKSFREPTTLSLSAGTTSRLSGNLLRHNNNERFVKSMALYGHNASGKTTILDGLYALRSFVLFSSQDQKPTSEIPRFESFALNQSSAKQPARVAVTMELEGSRYTLDVSATADRVWKEQLTVQHTTNQPTRRTPTITLIDRNWNGKKRNYSTKLHKDLGTDLTIKSVIEQTTPNRLMLGKLSTVNSQIALRLLEWFEDELEFYDMHRNPDSETAALTHSARLLKKDQEFSKNIARFMKDADTGIQSLNIVTEKTIEPVLSESEKLQFKDTQKPAIMFQHVTEDGSEVLFRRQKESSGTLRFVALLASILFPSPRRRLICIDELSASLHPDLVCRLIQIVHSSKYNPGGNQLLFTTHDTHLMNPAKLLRRDQITICTKDHFGRSAAIRLDEYQDAARSDANLQKQYLEGRFRGLAQFGPTLEDIPIDDEPTEVKP